jgi:hypothetical protein
MTTLKEWRGELILGSSFLAGIVLVALSRVFVWEWDKGFALEIGHALIIAPIVARGIELWMTRRIAQDVFRASFGYSMPDHFKEEIKRIADQKLICIRHRMYVHVELLDQDTVRATTRLHREIKNIGPHAEPLPALIHMDDWGFPEKSKIIRGKFSCAGDETEISPNDVRRGSDLTIKGDAPRTIYMPKGETAVTISEFSEIKRINDHLLFVFKAPTENPLIHLTLPDILDGRAEAGIPEGGGGDSSTIPGQYEFIGVYFPPSQMRIRWWPKEQAELQGITP